MKTYFKNQEPVATSRDYETLAIQPKNNNGKNADTPLNQVLKLIIQIGVCNILGRIK